MHISPEESQPVRGDWIGRTIFEPEICWFHTVSARVLNQFNVEK